MLYYIGYYTEKDNPENRDSFLSAVNKMDYISCVLQENGVVHQIVSSCITKDKKAYPASLKQLSEFVFLKQFKTVGSKTIFSKLLDLSLRNLRLLIYLIKELKPNDTLLVYHSLSYMRVISIVKKIRKCKLILEAEEIYADVKKNKKLKDKELKYLKNADAYIFPTELLDQTINEKKRPVVIVHGTYRVEKQREKIFEDEKIHVVYAGTFDPRKGGALAAVSATEFLPENYHVHVIGFGNNTDKLNLQREIEKIRKVSAGKVTYDGLLSGEDYIKFIQSCDIGLSTQNPSAKFNNTSFPSKILSYMSNGLNVVSIRIPVVECSKIGEYVYYYDNQTPEDIAKAILSVEIRERKNFEVIGFLDEDFTKEFNKFIQEVLQ